MFSLFALSGLYLALLFLIAWVTARMRSGALVVRHPLSYTLALGVYASSWSYFGHVGIAKSDGLLFLATHVGMSFAVMLAPAMLGKVLALTRDYQLASVADLFAFRYRSRLVGFLITVLSLVASLPYLAQQVRAVVGSYGAMTDMRAPPLLGLGFCVTLAIFAILFGTRDVSPRVQSDGLGAAIAFESLVKMSALLAVGTAAVTALGGLGGLDVWIASHPEAIRALHAPMREGSWSSLVLLAFMTAFLLPRQFHVAFAEGTTERSLRVAAWAFPLYLLLLNVPILPILWSGGTARAGGDPDFYVIAVARASGSRALAAFAFLGGVSASSAMVLVTLLALSSMCMNYIVSPARPAEPPSNLRPWLLWARRALIVALAAASWGTFEILEGNRRLIDWGYVSFVAIAQFFPGLIGVLFWRRATARGLVAGLAAGIGVWTFASFVPLFRAGAATSPIASIDDPLTFATFSSLTLNTLLFGAVSLLFPQHPSEEKAAAICVDGATLAAATPSSPARSPAELRERLARFLGPRMADEETARAIRDVELAADETSPLALRRLGERAEQNLSGIIGPLLARVVVDVGGDGAPALDEQLRALDQQLARDGSRLHGIAAELDRVRRFLGALLDDLPIGVCALDDEGRVVLYNPAMRQLTGVDSRVAEGKAVVELPSPWGEALDAIVASKDPAEAVLMLTVAGSERAVRVQRYSVDLPAPGGAGQVLLVEDTTARRKLETQVVYQDRVATIGYLAAGLAHGIRNPLAGISSIAQNMANETAFGEARDDLQQIVTEVERVDAIIRLLLDFGKRGPMVSPLLLAERVAVRTLVERAIGLSRFYRAERRLVWENRCTTEHTVLGDPPHLEQVLVNVLTNAADASPEGGVVLVESVAENGHIVLRVIDEGAGPPAAIADRLFEPFVTSKEPGPGRGSGLGLYIARDIVRNHRGTIGIERENGGRTVVTMRFPMKEEL